MFLNRFKKTDSRRQFSDAGDSFRFRIIPLESSKKKSLHLPSSMSFSGEFNFADCRFYEFRGNKFSPIWISNFPRALGTSFRRFGKSDVRNLYTATRDVILSCLFIFTVLISESSKRMTQSYRKARFRLPFGLGAEHVVN